MNKDNLKYLCTKFPQLFEPLINKPTKPKVILPIYFGLEVGDGWKTLIECLCGVLTNIYSNSGIITVAAQVKEKFGGLRFYYATHIDPKVVKCVKRKGIEKYYLISVGKLCKQHTVDIAHYRSEIDGAVMMAEEMSYHICENCGQPGSPNATGWISTLCGRCRKEADKRAKIAQCKYQKRQKANEARRKAWLALPKAKKQHKIKLARKYLATIDKLPVAKQNKSLATRKTMREYIDLLWLLDYDYMRARSDAQLSVFNAKTAAPTKG